MADLLDEYADVRSHLTASDFATLIAMADTDEVVRPRLLRAIRDLRLPPLL